MLVHMFGAKLSPCCANKVLNLTAQDDEETYSPEVITAVRTNFYVDNVFKSVPTPEQAIHLASDLTKLMKEGGFRLTKFASNSREVLQANTIRVEIKSQSGPRSGSVTNGMSIGQDPVARTLEKEAPTGPRNPRTLPHAVAKPPSSWPNLLRVMSWVLRFIKRCRRETHNAVPAMTPTLSELLSASREVEGVVQRECIHEEYVALKGGGQVKSSSKLANLSPILVNDVIRVGGRIHRAPIAYEATHPVVLPKSNPVSTLIVRYYHHILGHSGREHVLSAVRQCYWILRARSLVHQVLNKCVSCRKRNAPAIQQVMTDLPAERLVPYHPPFTYTGLEICGPFHVKRGRAIHIEDVGSLETDAFIQALRRFIPVRESPKKIWSDNGTNFTGAEKELSRSIQDLDDGTIRRELHRNETDWYRCAVPEWQFQPPTASHMSGVWERLIRSVRKAMKGVLGDQGALSGRETLRTVFAEVMSTLNSRPMCPASDDPNDMEALTPNHILLHRRDLVVPPGVFTKEELYTHKQWRHAQFLADCFWSMCPLCSIAISGS
ncbi:uncharacterized protein [Montipora foliosa]|uniref:uncharacterized protein n=1 Tax=Montipora foliosa TaxID=591990 RepID=UPI0035F1673F